MSSVKKNNWQKIFGSRWFLVILLLVAIFIATAYGRAYYRDYQVRQEISRLQDEVKRLEAKKIETMEILQYVKSSSFIEDKARTELNMIKPGEKVVVVAQGAGPKTSEDIKKVDYNPVLPNPVRWWNYFFGDLR